MLFDKSGSKLVRRDGTRSTGNDGDTDADGCSGSVASGELGRWEEEVLTEGTSLDLVSQAINDFRLRSDEQQTGGFDLLRELGVL